MKKVVIFGGGSGLSQLLKGLKLFPIDVTAVVSVADNGHSTGMLRKDFKIPAVGDISKVMLSMADISPDVEKMLNYRFTKSKTLGEHSIKNLLLTALLDIKGDFNHAIPVLCDTFNIKGTVLPLTEENVELVGYSNKNHKIIGEENITKCHDKIVKIGYNHNFKVNEKVLSAIKNADLIIFSSGSLLTSIIPHLAAPEIVKALKKSKAPKMYICNLVTQPGETDNFTVSDHIKFLEKYTGKHGIDIVLANDTPIVPRLLEKYATKEQKDPVIIDYEKLAKMNVSVIHDKTYMIENETIRHDSLKTAYLVFSYLMEGSK